MAGSDKIARNPRKTIFETWVEDGIAQEKMILMEGWARDGLLMEDIARNLGISPHTLSKMAKNYDQVRKALAKGREVVDYAVESALLKKAISGDVIAQIFWLKNRRHDRWRDAYETEIDLTEVRKVYIVDDVSKILESEKIKQLEGGVIENGE